MKRSKFCGLPVNPRVNRASKFRRRPIWASEILEALMLNIGSVVADENAERNRIKSELMVAPCM